VLTEFGIAIYHPEYDSKLDRWGSAFADLFIGIGVAGEVALSMWNNTLQGVLRVQSNKLVEEATKAAGEAKERAGKADERAAEARKQAAEVERLTAWRRVSPEQRRQISDAIRDMTSALDVLIEWERGDAEAFSYSCEIVRIFIDAGVGKTRGIANSWLGLPLFGLHAAGSATIDFPSIASAFAKAKMPLAPRAMDLSTYRPINEPAPNLYIYVAPKLPPQFELSM